MIILLVKTTPTINIVVVGRDEDKMKTKVNIIRVSGLIRGVNKSRIDIEAGVDLKFEIHAIQRVMKSISPILLLIPVVTYLDLSMGVFRG